MSTGTGTGTDPAPPPAAPTMRDLAAEYKQKQDEVKALQAKGGDNLENLTLDDGKALNRLLDARDAVKAKLDAFGPVESFRSRVAEGDVQLKARPPVPLPATIDPATRDGLPAAVKGDLESELEKFLDRGPFKSMGHMLYEVRRAGDRPGLARDGVLGKWNYGIQEYDHFVKSHAVGEYKAVTGMSEMSDSDGGMLAPITFAQGIWERVQGEESLLARLNPMTVAGNLLKVKAWNDKGRTGDTLFGGARAYWTAEGAEISKSNPTLRDIEVRLNKLAVLMAVTEELLEDAPALDSELTRIAGQCFTYMINKAIIRGGGVGQPLGILASPALITQTAVSAQGAGTVVAQNIDEMWSRRPYGSTDGLVWLVNRDVEPVLQRMYYSTGTANGQLVYLPPGGLSGSKYATLKGAPIIECEHCSTVGTIGDIILVNFDHWVAAVKGTGIKGSVSMHVRFDYDEAEFKWTFRMDARPRWEAPLTPATSATTLSPLVALSSTRT